MACTPPAASRLTTLRSAPRSNWPSASKGVIGTVTTVHRAWRKSSKCIAALLLSQSRNQLAELFFQDGYHQHFVLVIPILEKHQFTRAKPPAFRQSYPA